jgi:hypothetical protein
LTAIENSPICFIGYEWLEEHQNNFLVLGKKVEKGMKNVQLSQASFAKVNFSKHFLRSGARNPQCFDIITKLLDIPNYSGCSVSSLKSIIA